MPLYSNKHTNNRIVALWHISESKEELEEMLPKSWLEKLDLARVRKHNLAARVLAHTVCPDFDILEKDEYGKPYFESTTHKISLSHAGDYAAFQLNENDECGIDMEKITHRIKRIKDKFMREDEHPFLDFGLRGMYLVWCAKEALYKYYGLKALDFKQHMKIDFTPLDQESGSFTGHIGKDDYQKTLKLDYTFFDDYLMVNTQ